MSSNMSSPSFDPFSQSFTLLMADGTPFNVTMSDLDGFIQYNTTICINYASQLGASLMLLVVLILLTKSEKRRSPVFVLNCLALVINILRMLFQCLYFTDAFSEAYAYLAADYSRVPTKDYATSVAGEVMNFLLLICIEISLVLQTQVVCTTLRDLYRRILFVVSTVVALIAIGFRFALTIEASKFILNAAYSGSLNWLKLAADVVATISIWFFCLVFTAKLGFAIRQRRQLGLKQFGPMQVIFIMGCQTMIIPAIFSILEYFTPIPELGSGLLTLVAIFLPLSSIWASASLENRPQQPSGSGSGSTMRRKLFGSYASGSTALYSERKGSAGHPLSPSSNTTTTRVSNSPLPSPAKAEMGDIYTDLEAGEGVRVDRTFGVAQGRN